MFITPNKYDIVYSFKPKSTTTSFVTWSSVTRSSLNWNNLLFFIRKDIINSLNVNSKLTITRIMQFSDFVVKIKSDKEIRFKNHIIIKSEAEKSNVRILKCRWGWGNHILNLLTLTQISNEELVLLKLQEQKLIQLDQFKIYKLGCMTGGENHLYEE